MGISKNNITCWIVSEGLAGTENQCIGVAQSLDISYDIKRIALNQPWKSLSPFLGFEQDWSFTPRLTPPWPDILIASGRKSIAASRYIKAASQGRTFTVQIQDPRIPARHFDLVAVPDHDPLRGDNVIVTKAAPNKITAALLQQAKEAFPAFGTLPSPRVAVLIGGSSKAYTMSEDITHKLAQDLTKIDASLMITCSRRTGDGNQAILKAALDNKGHYFWDGTGENPYMALLAWADIILVTADSASMLSESCTTEKPVYMIDLEGGSKRLSKLHQNLMEHGALKKFNGALETFSYVPLNDSLMVAGVIEKRLKDFTITTK
tara:strand:- start:2526 stop:3485 length:960 start_codon:yes stop_codon:yes gene_type:complete